MAKASYVPSGAKIKVIGLGGGGSNAITRMVRDHVRGVEFIAMNTDAQALAVTEAAIRVQLGERLTRGLGAGGDNAVGRKAAEESYEEIKQVATGADMVFITCGMGGGTGTGSAPVVARVAKESGALTIAVVTKPFSFEGSHRGRVAENGIAELMEFVDTLIIIPNDRLLALCDHQTEVDGAFRLADETLRQGVQAIAEVVTVPGLINLDFADVRSIMKDAGPAWMSVGYGNGRNGAEEAARKALASPLLDVSVRGATGVLFNVAGGEDLSLFEVNRSADIIREAVSPNANVIFGVVVDPNIGKNVRLTLIATGFASKQEMVGDRNAALNSVLRGMREGDLDVPSFVRWQQGYPRQQNTRLGISHR